LMMPSFSGTKDDFGKEIMEPFPLLFDRINEGQPFSSNFLISRLPIELVWHVIKLIDNEDLGRLALVNRDCRQLARSRQFATIRLDYSDKSMGILSVLVNECKQRSEYHGKTREPSIGACIRKIIVAADPRWITSRHEIELSDEFYALESDIRNKRMDQACEAFFGDYITNISLVLSNTITLPHLERLVWADRAPLDRALLKAIVSSNLRHLVLDRVSIGEEILSDYLANNCKWRLESLYLDLLSGYRQNIPTTPLVCSLLCLASPALKTLAWISSDIGPGPSVQLPESFNEYPSFRRLQDLHIDSLTKYDPAWLNVLVQPGASSPICSLAIDISKNEVVADFFRQCGYLPNLQTFVWLCCGFEMRNPYLDFLQANPHIRKLRIDGAASNFLEKKVFPLLLSRFECLSSLSVRWPEDENHIPPSALKQISGLRTLEQLCLSSGCQAGWRHSWLIDHSAIQDCVQKLPKLRKLAFSRDTYTGQNSIAQIQEDPQRYYVDKTLRKLDTILARPYFQEGNIEQKLDRAWEMQHSNDMIQLAAKYATKLPELEWIYLGQRPIRIVHNSHGTGKCVLLSTARDDCWTYLRKLFG
ncbi:hypothetical protein COCCADRAFT_61867, partial [Bipolaris zeicola 26-R-13]